MVENHIHKGLHREKRSREYGEREREREKEELARERDRDREKGRESKNSINYQCGGSYILFFVGGVRRMF